MISALHIDDEQDFLDLTRAFLEKSGDIRLEGVTSAVSALEKLKETRYDAIVSDYQMPGMDGITLLKHLREGGDRIPFIILCGDDGTGIPPHEKEKIFSPGYGRKTGYGLFLVREILGITGATIREIGQEGEGALFEIAVPKDAYQVRE